MEYLLFSVLSIQCLRESSARYARILQPLASHTVLRNTESDIHVFALEVFHMPSDILYAYFIYLFT